MQSICDTWIKWNYYLKKKSIFYCRSCNSSQFTGPDVLWIQIPNFLDCVKLIKSTYVGKVKAILGSLFFWHIQLSNPVFQLGFQKGRVLVLKKGTLVRCWIYKKGSFRDTVKSNKVYNQILTFIIYTWANRSVYSTNQPR